MVIMVHTKYEPDNQNKNYNTLHKNLLKLVPIPVPMQTLSNAVASLPID